MEILKEFGINPILLIAQIINFIIILYVLKRFLYKPIMTTLANRQKDIKESIKQNEESRRLLEKAEKREKEILKEAQSESKKIIEETRKQGSQIISEAQQAAKIQTQKIITEAKKQIEIEAKEAQRKLMLEAGSLATEYLQKSIAQMFDKEDEQKIINRAVKQIKKRGY